MKQNVETALYPAPLTISHISMVGATAAELKVFGRDQSTLAMAMRATSALGLELSPAFETFGFRHNKIPDRDITDADAHLIRKINIDPAEGGQDFLDPKTMTDTDLLVFCNIAHGNSESLDGGHIGQLMSTFRNQTVDQIDPVLLAALGHQNDSMQVSPMNANDTSWRSAIDRSGANIAYFNSISDDYPPERLGGDDFISVSDRGHRFRGLVIRREFLQRASDALVERDDRVDFEHPLMRLAAMSQNSSRSNFSLDLLGAGQRGPVHFFAPR